MKPTALLRGGVAKNGRLGHKSVLLLFLYDSATCSVSEFLLLAYPRIGSVD
jgi:hypothetical protein